MLKYGPGNCSLTFKCALNPTPEGQNFYFVLVQGQNFKMITSAKHEGYISVWARVRSTRVSNIIHHEGRGCNAYKDKLGPLSTFRSCFYRFPGHYPVETLFRNHVI